MRTSIFQKIEEEGDRKEFQHLGLECLILRHSELKHLCGYVGISLDMLTEAEKNRSYEDWDIDCHGGLTFGALGNDDSKWKKGYLWLGFDCAHLGDVVPSTDYTQTDYTHRDSISTYKDMAFVDAQLRSMCEQLRRYLDARTK